METFLLIKNDLGDLGVSISLKFWMDIFFSASKNKSNISVLSSKNTQLFLALGVRHVFLTFSYLFLNSKFRLLSVCSLKFFNTSRVCEMWFCLILLTVELKFSKICLLSLFLNLYSLITVLSIENTFFGLEVFTNFIFLRLLFSSLLTLILTLFVLF